MTLPNRGLRPIDRLDQEKINRAVKAIKELAEQNSNNRWLMGDALLAEFPIQDHRDVMVSIWKGEEAKVRPYLEAVARRTGMGVGTVASYRSMASCWPPDQRVVGASFAQHRIVSPRNDRVAVLQQAVKDGLSCDALRLRLGLEPGKTTKRTRQRERSFANISKAAEAAIEVLEDETIPAETRVRHARNILVQFFEEAAA
jgi:hypothetical protein